MGKRIDAIAEKKTHGWIIAETIVWSLFILTAAIAGANLEGWLPESKLVALWLGRILLGFGLLAFFYITFKASQKRSE